MSAPPRRLDPTRWWPFRAGSFPSRLHDEPTAALLGVALGACLAVCFATGLFSHLTQDPGAWFDWPSRPAGLYRVTQGLHVATGLAAIPLLLAKLWAVYPNLFRWPPFTSPASALERLALLPLVGGALMLLATGLGNIHVFRPWAFSFRSGHYAAAWVTIGALLVHVGAKWSATRSALRHPVASTADAPGAPGLSRRGFLATALGAAGVVTLFTAGQTVGPLRRLALLAPRRPDVGPQGFPVNRTARSVGLVTVDLGVWRLTVDGPGATRSFTLTYDELRALPQHEADLPIACVEGWSTTQRWRGVRVRDLLELAGARADAEAVAVAMHRSRRQKYGPMNRHHAHDPDTLLALEVHGEVLAPDHGFPLRLVGPNRPGVLQTKWVDRLEIR